MTWDGYVVMILLKKGDIMFDINGDGRVDPGEMAIGMYFFDQLDKDKKGTGGGNGGNGNAGCGCLGIILIVILLMMLIK